MGRRRAGRRARRRPVRAAALALLALAACASGPALRDELQTPAYAVLARRWAQLERHPVRVPAADPGAPPLAMQVVAVPCPRPPRGPLLVLLHGVLADHTTWRFLAPLLAQRHDLLLVDLPGCGGSDGPDPARAAPGAYTPEWLGRHALRAAENWQHTRGDRRGTIWVGHSLGSAAILRALGDAATRRALPRATGRVAALVLFAPPDVLAEHVDPQLEAVARLSDAEAEVGCALGLLDRKVDASVRDGVVDPDRRALRGEAWRLSALLADARSRHVAQAMLRRWRPLDEAGRPRPAALRALAAAETRVAVPTLVISGARDETVPPAQAAAVARRLPHASLWLVPDARHSVQQERAAAAAQRIGTFLGSVPAGAGRGGRGGAAR
jgi:pimeloyl-ACP methyl ester carboxylesterase